MAGGRRRDLAEEMHADVAVVSVDGLELEALSTVPRATLARDAADAASRRRRSGSAARHRRSRAEHRSGPVVPGVLVFAEEQDADMIVVGGRPAAGRAAHVRHGRPRGSSSARAGPCSSSAAVDDDLRDAHGHRHAEPGAFATKPVDALVADDRGAGHQLKRSVGLLDLSALGLGAIIGTGIFVILGEAIGDAGPAIVLSFVLAGLTCAFSALSYAELASTIPVAGSAYTYSYATMGELIAWIIGWDLILEYGVSVAAVAVGWGGYLNELLDSAFGFTLPDAISQPPGEGGVVNLPAVFLVLAVAALLIAGFRESARANTVMVVDQDLDPAHVHRARVHGVQLGQPDPVRAGGLRAASSPPRR